MTSPLASVVGTIVEKTAVLSHLLGEQNIAPPTFDEGGYTAYSGENAALRQTRYDLVRAAQDLLRLAQGPEDQILQLAWSSADTTNLAVLLRFEIPQGVPLNGTISGKELATKVGLPEDILLRTMRYAIGSGVFVESAAGIFAHNAASASLARSEDLRNIANVSTQELSQILLSLPQALKLQQEKGPEGPQAAFNVAFPQYGNIFEFLAKDPAASKRYHQYMVGRANTARWSAMNMIKAWDWGSVGTKTIVDVGGSAGHTCLALVASCPEAKFVVQDVDPVALEHGRQMIAKFPGLAPRASFVQHDFFQPQTTEGDIYVFRHIFHDWNDEDTVRILKNTVAGLKDGARILVTEGIVPPPPAQTANTLDEKQILVEDMFMLSVHNGRERTVDDFIKLFKEADPRYEYVGTTGGVNGAFQSIVEFKFTA